MDSDKKGLIGFLFLFLSSLRIEESRILRKGGGNNFREAFR